MSNPWFRLYTEIIDDEKIRMLAFEDRWHYVALLCLKNSGYLDKEHKPGMFERGLSVKLGLTGVDLENLRERLLDVDLISDDWQPIGWEKRQFKDTSAAARQKRYRERKKLEESKDKDTVTGSVTEPLRNVTSLDTERETEADSEADSERENPHTWLPSRICPADFIPDPAFIEMNRHRFHSDIDLDLELTKFKNHEFNAQKTDWNRAFVKWCLTAKPEKRNATADGRNKLQQRTDELLRF